MTTAPDRITSTAPERIYLDLGDCAHLIKPEETFATYAQGEITWSEGNDSGVGIPYVRADLVPTPAASGAAPTLPSLPAPDLWMDGGSIKGYSTLPGPGPWFTGQDMRDYARAALASREASEPMGTVQAQGNTVYVLNDLGCNRWTLSVQPGRDDNDSRVSDAECIAVAQRIVSALNATAAALASPQVAPAPKEQQS